MPEASFCQLGQGGSGSRVRVAVADYAAGKCLASEGIHTAEAIPSGSPEKAPAAAAQPPPLPPLKPVLRPLSHSSNWPSPTVFDCSLQG